VDPKVRTTVEKQSHEEGELSPENGEFLNNGHETQAEFIKPADQRAHSDDSNHNRYHLLLPQHLIFIHLMM
jgi:peptidyl-prolyl isomerase G (cyclophilin G)